VQAAGAGGPSPSAESGPSHLRTVPVRTDDVGGSCGGLHLFPTALHSAAVRTEESPQTKRACIDNK
jgi:hypothetical protein